MDASQNNDNNDTLSRRRFLNTVVGVVGGAGAVAAAIPFVSSFKPSAKAEAAGAPVEVNIAALKPGERITVEWRGNPIWVLRRTEAQLAELNTPKHLAELADPDSKVVTQQPNYAQNPNRSLNPEYLVVIGICTHLGCSPTFRPEFAPADLGANWVGGFFCPCHGSKFDLAGRVFKNVPAPTNLVIPPHHFPTSENIFIGLDGVSV
jgi:ubiquinol-cytochrome c reductase iron-sulfur subunit